MDTPQKKVDPNPWMLLLYEIKRLEKKRASYSERIGLQKYNQ